MLRWIGRGLLALGLLLLIAGAGILLLGDRIDLAPLVAGRATAALGRTVAIGALHVTPGRWLHVDLRDARLDDVAGGSQPLMAQVAHVTADIQAVSLLRRPLVLRNVRIDGLQLLIERTQQRVANWRFGPPRPAPPQDRSGLPTLLDATLNGEITFRTRSGLRFVTRLHDATIRTAGAADPVRLAADGDYDDVPLRLDADLAPIAVLRDAATPFPTDIRITSGDTALHFQGTMTQPLDIDGAHGTLTLDAPTADALLGIAGVQSNVRPSLHLAGAFDHEGPVWQLGGASGALGDAKIPSALLRLDEGAHGAPDRITVELGFDDLDLNALLARKPAGAASDADVPLSVDPAPDPQITARLSASRLSYGKVRADTVSLAAAQTPGRIAVDAFALGYVGSQIRGSGRVDAVPGNPNQGSITTDVSFTGMDVQALRRLLGFGRVPLLGPMDGQVTVSATGATLNDATRGARIAAVVGMTRGSVSREVIELASINPLALLPSRRGMSALTCMVGVLDMRAGVGTVLPLRVRSQDGTITGSGQFDIYRGTLDVVVGSDSRTTGPLALDIPVRISGSFASPTIRPARWSADGRARLAAATDPSRLPPDLRSAAQRSPCLGGAN